MIQIILKKEKNDMKISVSFMRKIEMIAGFMNISAEKEKINCEW